MQRSTRGRNRFSNFKHNWHFGDKLLPYKPPNTTRLHGQNTNGFQLSDDGGTLLTAATHLRELQVDGGGFFETNVDTTKHQVRSKIFNAFRKTSKYSKVQCSSSDIPAHNEYKPGGTITYVHDDLTSRVQSKGADPLGRWSHVTFTRRGNQKVTFISAYQPCKGKPKPDSFTAAAQQYSMLLKAKRENPANVRKHFVKDLKRFLRKCSKDGQEVILMGNFNEVLGVHSHGMSKVCRELDLTDAIHYFHGPPETPFSTWIDGKEILDYILVSRSLLPFIKACGYEPFLQHINGDHRGMFIDFDTTALFGAPDSRLAPLAQRKLQATNPKHVTIYFEKQYEYLIQHNYFPRLEHLQHHPDDALAEALDRTRTRACLYAEAKLPRYPDVPYSPAIANARNHFNILKMVLYQHKHQIGFSDQLWEPILRCA